MKLTGFLVSLAGLTQMCLEAPAPGYEVAEFEWEVQTKPEGPLHHVNGTVQDVLESRQGRIEARQRSIICFNFPTANGNRIQDGIGYLRGVRGQPSNGPGPGNCGRVSCSNNAAIWWCNDNRSTYTLPSFSVIADGAQNVKQTCQRLDSKGFTETAGQGFFDGNWNVIVRGDSC
ncbi:hypothetical protein F5883DRAFT_600191 [Diaporthe sp. PMI_573]|nr:hypothetical protein F5883DRAFT_600191 [Diaporthaceae sp. PMI_573]